MTASHHVPGVRSVIGVDAGTVSLREADHLVHRLADGLGLPDGTIACTHLVRTADRRGTTVSFALPDEAAAGTVWQRLTGLADPEPDLGAVLGDRTHGPVPAARTAEAAVAEHVRRSGGRAVLYPGADRLTGTVTLADLLATSAIERVVVVGAPFAAEPDPRTPVVTQDHVRPEWRDGRLTLALVPAAGGTLAPFEVPNPTPCCADHS
ncbi:hypothetical protein ACFC09_13645 [Streptomyces sp. NPDC056161]|uniref:hypothetical protein n=1 Tax=Streptomyces sp. NPDC056161 TaxID=3345732 RepID=UPI0035E1A679